MPIEKIIVLEDDQIVRKNLEHQLRQRRYDVASATTIADAQELLGKDNFDLIFVDIRLPDGEGTELLKQIQTRPVKPLVVMITGFGSVESAVTCMRDGAFDYIIKPFSTDTIEVTLRKAEDFTRLVKVSQYLSREEGAETGYELLGRSPAMDGLRALIRKVARTQATVLIQGESGTGKELVARAIYMESTRANAPFIKVNCAAIPENLIESEFFGHEKGSFTGALTKREGRFELAHGGTILLDEVSEVSPQVQAKLLRVLQERELERVGGNRTIKVDVRVIATTNRNLEQSVEKKEFRQDLFFRLNVVPILVPPLRERMEDVPYLSDQFMHRMARKHGVRVSGISPACMAALMAHSWPGNVRELQNVVERAVILCSDGQDLQPEHLGFVPLSSAIKGEGGAVLPANVTPFTAPAALTPDQILPLHELEKQHILRALEICEGNRTQAAKHLDISIRTLRNKLHEYGGTTPSAGGDEPEPQEGTA
ncbi:MAG TPA: sigma-54 dependent transcriptional regulator [Verrucomicrobiae bacterium]|jgi:DNA-binding NtrC family response regulator|nr:sigma-54 dependent transcriptional regulator [Verrucomicrobiae bacterium]